MGWGRTHRVRPNRRPNKIIKKKDRKQDGLFRTLGRLGNERGPTSERHCASLLRELVVAGLIADVYESEQGSWGDAVLKADIFVRRRDGKVVPIQVKNQYGGVQSFIEKWSEYCSDLFGRMPVFAVIPSVELVGDEREKKKQKILRFVHGWHGRLVFAPWMKVSSPFFHYRQHKRMGFRARIEAFKQANPQYFVDGVIAHA